ncbi:MAG: hypothetical protein GYB65_14245, partial [Chloroflexi bacterium]|nr:hypothetical protein [Chloroflexota bacterium]
PYVEREPIEIDEDGMPLPARVPQDDLGATLVSPSTPLMEPVRRSEAPTYTRTPQIEDDNGDPVSAAEPGGELTQPSRPAYDDEAGDPQQTLRSESVHADQYEQYAAEGDEFAAEPQPGGEAISEPKPNLGEFPQPDYSAALSRSYNRNTFAKWGVRLFVISLIGGMAMALLVVLGLLGYYFFTLNEYRDAINSLDQRAASFENAKIFDADGNLLAEFADPEESQRESVPLDQISPWLIHATISTENETFYTDQGFSLYAIGRATVENLRAGGVEQGASTITQQLARALVLDAELASERSAERKLIEIFVASEIKRQYSPNEILEIYLNEIFYGNYASGVEAAAQTYFGKPASELNPAEAAFLAGLPQSPATYDPVVNRQAANNRMWDVLHLMAVSNNTGCVAIQHDDRTIWAIPNGGELCIREEVVQEPDGTESYLYSYRTSNSDEWIDLAADIAIVEALVEFNRPTFTTAHPHFVNYVWQQLERTYGAQAAYNAGFRIYTTLDQDIQTAAENAVTNQLITLQNQGYQANNATVVVIRPQDGAVLAMVGSADFENEDIDGQVNVALTAQQPGSAIKPIVYLAALEPDPETNEYWTPATVIWDVPTDFSGYQPRNYDDRFHGPVTMREALGNSYNIPAVKALDYVGLGQFTELALRMGIEFPLDNPVDQNAGLPAALGAVEVTPLSLTSAFGVLANNGRKVDPYSIVYIEDKDGNEIFRANTSPEGLQVVQPEYAYLMTSILSDNSARLPAFSGVEFNMQLNNGRIAAVKTGTSNGPRDVWTVGYTPQIVTGVWVGRSDDDPLAQPWQSISGSTAAAPIWKAVMEAAHADLPVENFSEPGGVTDPIEVCRASGAMATAECAGYTYFEIFASEALPPSTDETIFQTMQVDDYTGKLVNEYCPDEPVTRTFIVIEDQTAYNWINTTLDGQTWAQARGLQTPLQAPPTDFCSPDDPRPNVQFTFPREGAQVTDIIQVRGVVEMPGLVAYEISFGLGENPTSFSNPLPLLPDVAVSSEAEIQLADLDTRSLTQQYGDGAYTLRLTAYDNQGRTVTREVMFVVSNPGLAPAQPAQDPSTSTQLGTESTAPQESTPLGQ